MERIAAADLAARHGPSVNQGVTFSPNAKVSYDFTKKIAGGLEYYAAYGSLASFDGAGTIAREGLCHRRNRAEVPAPHARDLPASRQQWLQ
jgi:hypothetical protein